MTDQGLKAVKDLFVEYQNFLREEFFDCLDLPWTIEYDKKFDEEIENLSVDYIGPNGCLLLATYRGEPAGCVALKNLDGGECEMKRLYVKDDYRGLKIGKSLAEGVIEQARKLGYRSMKLDTNRRLEAATGLYRSLGFKEIEPYEENPLDGAVFMELKLTNKNDL